MSAPRSRDGKFELRHTSALNPYVEMYGDSDEEQTDFTWELVRVPSGEVVATFSGWIDHKQTTSGTQSVEFAPDGNALLVDGQRVEIADLVRQKREAVDATLLGLALTADGRTVAVSTASGRVAILDAPKRRVLRSFQAPVGGRGLAWSPDGNSLVATTRTGVVYMDANDGRVRWEGSVGDDAPGSFVFSPDGAVIAAIAGYPAKVTLVNAKDGAILRHFKILDSVLGFMPDSGDVVYRHPTGAIVSQPVKSGTTTEVHPKPKGDARLCAVVPSRDRLVLRDWDHFALESLGGTAIARFEGKARDAVASGDGATIVAAIEGQYNAGVLYGDPHHLRVIDVASGRELTRFEGIVNAPMAVGDGRLWDTGHDHGLYCRDLETGKVQAVPITP